MRTYQQRCRRAGRACPRCFASLALIRALMAICRAWRPSCRRTTSRAAALTRLYMKHSAVPARYFTERKLSTWYGPTGWERRRLLVCASCDVRIWQCVLHLCSNVHRRRPCCRASHACLITSCKQRATVTIDDPVRRRCAPGRTHPDSGSAGSWTSSTARRPAPPAGPGAG